MATLIYSNRGSTAVTNS